MVDLAQRYRISLQSALWRYVATNEDLALAVVLDASPLSRSPILFKRHEVVPSQTYVARFGHPRWPSRLGIERYPFLAEAAATCAGRTVVSGQWVREDLAGEPTILRTECLATPYRVLVLIWLPRRKSLRRRVKLVA